MRAVLDTNVLVSAVFRRAGPPDSILQAWYDGDFDVITSAALLREFEGVLERPWIKARSGLSEAELAGLITKLRDETVLVAPQTNLSALQDEADNRVLEAALAGQADYIVTGDRALLDLSEFEGVLIASPARFVTMLRDVR